MNRLREVSWRARRALLGFLQLETSAGLLLAAMALLAMIVANSPWAAGYHDLFALRLPVGTGPLAVDKSLHDWINDGLMALFFLLVGLELKRELREGQLSMPGLVRLPALCALGGMLGPMLIYAAINRGDPVAMRGIAIPAATDIAFALGVVTLLGSRVPMQLKLLLTAIAVLDDVAAILIIAVFYTEQLSFLSLGVAALALLALAALNWRGVASLAPYLAIGALLWIAVAMSGVHATLAGVALGFAVPLQVGGETSRSPARRLEHSLHPWVAFGILPVFAFANAGLPLQGFDWQRLATPVPLGVMLGLALGKPAGVLLAALFARRFRLATWPQGMAVAGLFGVGLLCGIGFTMSLFIRNLAFDVAPGYAGDAQLAVMLASLVSAVAGYAWMRFAVRDGEP